ncbi:MAG: type IV secretory system conjugative DNA transfer family protein [Alphaproteobacteria bacterium]
MVEACAQVWGGADMSATPLLKKCLKAVFYALLVRGLSLADAFELISSAGALRRELTQGLPDHIYAALWDEFNALSRREFAEQFSSTSNRLTEFLGSPLIRRIVGQKENTLDFRRIMDEGDIVICNFSDKGNLSEDNARVIGTLITRELFLLAKTRDIEVAKRHPFYLYIDECYKFLSRDVLHMLDETRKFGLHVTLAHQRLSQLRAHGDEIYNGVMGGAANKIVFRIEDDAEAQVLALQVMRDHIDLERPKHALDKPVVVDEVPIWLDSESNSSGESDGRSVSEGIGWSLQSGASEGTGEGFRIIDGQPPEQVGASTSQATFSSEGSSGSAASTESWSRFSGSTVGRSQTLKPVRTVLPTAVYSLEEEVHRLVNILRRLPHRVAMVRPAGRTAVRVRTPDVRDPIVWPELVDAFCASASTASPYVIPVATAEAHLVERRQRLRSRGLEPATNEDFWHEVPEPPGGRVK